LQRSGVKSIETSLLAKAELLGPAKVVAANVGDADLGQLKKLADRLREGIGSGVVILGGAKVGQAGTFDAVAKDLAPGVDAGALVAAALGVAERGVPTERTVVAIDGDDVRTYQLTTPFEREESTTAIVRAEVDQALREARNEAARRAEAEVEDDPALRGVATARLSDDVAGVVLDGRPLESLVGYHGRSLEVHTDVSVAPLVLSGAALATVAS